MYATTTILIQSEHEILDQQISCSSTAPHLLRQPAYTHPYMYMFQVDFRVFYVCVCVCVCVCVPV